MLPRGVAALGPQMFWRRAAARHPFVALPPAFESTAPLPPALSSLLVPPLLPEPPVCHWPLATGFSPAAAHRAEPHYCPSCWLLVSEFKI